MKILWDYFKPKNVPVPTPRPDAPVSQGRPSAPTGSPSNINKAGIALMHKYEGCRLKAYPDPGSKDGNPWTIGWGSTGPGISKGVVWTQQQADARFEQDVAKFAAGVAKLIQVPVTSNQFSALVAFSYNVGLGAFRDSTMLRLINKREFGAAAEQFGRWTRNDGKIMQGLVNRRNAEKALFLS